MILTAFSFTRVAALLSGSVQRRRQPRQERHQAAAPAAVAGLAPTPEVELREGEEAAISLQQMRGIGDTLPSLVNGSRNVGWWGIVFLILIEVVVFTALIASYFYLRSGAPAWPAGGIEPPELLLPTINTVILLACALPVYWSTRSIRRGNRTQFLLGLAVSIVLGSIFLYLKYVEYSDKGYNWSANAYASIVWTMTGFHIAHVTAVLLKSLAIGAVGLEGFFDERRHVAAEGNAIYWYFVIAVWVPLYLTIYVSPRLI